MATAPSSLIIFFFLCQVWVLKFSRGLTEGWMPSKHTRTYTPATPTRSLAPPRQGSRRHMPRPPMCPLYARTWHPRGSYGRALQAGRAFERRSEGQLAPAQEASKTRGSSKVAGLPTSRGYPSARGGAMGHIRLAQVGSGRVCCLKPTGSLLRDHHQGCCYSSERQAPWVRGQKVGTAPGGRGSAAPSILPYPSRWRVP